MKVSAATANSAQAIDALLPQTQCTRCGFAGCRPYAEAIAAGGSDINRCPPGGEATIQALARLTGRAPLPLDPECGASTPLRLAVVDETACIGCTLCIAACPVDAIIGGPKRMHAILESLCSGCELCLPPCPVDCIRLVDAGRAWSTDDANAARTRHEARNDRVARNERIAARRAAPPAPSAIASTTDAAPRQDSEQRTATIAAAVERARARRATRAATRSS